jgi:ribosomal protein S18 acetylase RimI-like enzyme
MTADEFDAYLAWSVDDYAAELVRNERATAESAPEVSRSSFDRLLPEGLGTPGQVLLIAEDEGTGARVGMLWFGPSSDEPTRAWIFDISVDEPERGKGWGRAILTAFEPEARARGFSSAGLNVFADNDVARHLYESSGYAEIQRQMAKSL